MSNHSVQISTETADNYDGPVPVIRCSCGYHAISNPRFAQFVADQHIAHPVAHLDPRLVIG